MSLLEKKYLGKEILQHCGDIFKITSFSKKGNNLVNGEFIKYPCYLEDIYLSNVLAKKVNNPEKSLKEFISKDYLQHCGDILKIIGISKEKDKWGRTLYDAEFINHPYKVSVLKQNIEKGTVSNPQIEIDEFINKEFKQNCGDILIPIEKTNQRTKDGKGNILYRCKFKNHPYEVLATKKHIEIGCVNNPQIEIDEFIGKEFLMNCGDILLVLKKTEERLNIKENGDKGDILFECEFQKYKCKVKATKSNILKRSVDNPALPYKSKESLEKYLIENFKQKDIKPSLRELSKSLNLSWTLSSKIKEWKLQEYINYYPNEEEESLRTYVKEIYKDEVTIYSGTEEEHFYEIDIYIPNKKKGIEYNGSNFHEEGNINNIFSREIGYHKKKEEFFKERGIEILFIWDKEWFEDYPKNTIISKKCQQKIKDFINE